MSFPVLMRLRPRGRQARIRWPRFLETRQGVAGLLMLTFILGITFIGPLLAPHQLDAPIGVPAASASSSAPLGTDFLGRDVLSRVLDGGLPVLLLAAITVGATYLLGVLVGMTAAVARGLIDPMLMRALDVLIAFPPLLLLLVMIAGAGTGVGVLGAGIVLVLFPGVARIVRSASLEVATTGYVEAALSRGERLDVVMRREVLPNITPAILADFGVRFGSAIVIIATVEFLGLGAQPPAANWALMVAENRPIITTNVLSVAVPALLLAVLTLSVNMLADAYVRTLGRSEGRR